MAKDLLQEMGQKALYVTVDDLESSEEMENAVAFANELTGDSGYPKIWINGEYFGSVAELETLASNPDEWKAKGLYTV